VVTKVTSFLVFLAEYPYGKTMAYYESARMRCARLIPLVLAVALTGCAPAVVVRPLYNEKEKAPVDKRIEGDWVNMDIDHSGTKDIIDGHWTVGRYNEYGGYSVIIVVPPDTDGEKEETELEYEVRLLPIGDKLFFDAEFYCKKFGPRKICLDDMGLGVISGHIVGRLWIQQDFIRMAFLDSDWVRNKTSEKLWVDLGGDSHITAITAPAEDVQALLVREADDVEAFKNAVSLCRPGVPCAARAAEEELSRYPKDSIMIDEVAELYLRQGNYVRAIELRRRNVELEPKITNNRLNLVEALLLNREFEAARREAATTGKAEPLSLDLVCSYIARSYFFEGKYDDAVKTTADCPPRRLTFSKEILFDYFALLRLGRTTDARAMLEKETAALHGLWGEHALLLEFQGRLYGELPAFPKEAAFRRSLFQAMQWTAKGESAKATAVLQELVKTGDRDSLDYLAAQIEFERLTQSFTH
jgi:tetratricopeptide (TPR) repeat protein